MNPQHLSANPSSMRSRFAEGFIRALTKINRKAPTSSSPRETIRRYRSVKTAADKSLACAVGSRRAWSRAMLFRIRNQTRKRRKADLVRKIKHPQVIAKRRNVKNKNIGLQVEKEINDGGDEVGVIGQADELRRLVPGGEAMDLCRLLDEAAHYIRCLNTQAQVMRCIADSYPTT